LNQFEDGARVDETALRSVGLANGKSDGVKILGTGELTKKLTVVASAVSASAKAKIEAKGGTVEIVARKSAAAVKAA
jgi:large subunit ribosomal protein L15